MVDVNVPPMTRFGILFLSRNKKKMTILRSINQTSWDDTKIRNLKDDIIAGRSPYKSAEVRGNHVFINGRQIVPNNQVKDVIKREYEKSYQGMAKLYKQITQKYLNITARDVQAYLHADPGWQRFHKQEKVPVIKTRVVKDEGNIWQMDILSFHETPILTCVDLFSGFARAEILPDKTAHSVTLAFKRMTKRMTRTAQPKMVQTDNGGEFKEEFSKHLKDNNIKQVYGTAGRPTSQAHVERFNGTLRMALERRRSSGLRWKQWMKTFIDEYNSTPHTSSGMPPASIKTDQDKERRVNQQIKHAQEQSKDVSRLPSLKVGDRVRIRILRKGALVKSGLPEWSEDISTISKIKGTTTTYPQFLVNNRWYSRNDLQLIR